MPIQIFEGKSSRVRGHLFSENAREWIKATVGGILFVVFVYALFHLAWIVPEGL